MQRNNFIRRTIMGAFSFLEDSIFSDEYSARCGFLQGIHPRFKFLLIVFFLLAVMFSQSIYFLVGIYLLCLLLAHLSTIRLGFFLKRTWVFIPLFSLCIVIPALFSIFSPGQPVLSFKFLSHSLNITRQGIASASFFFLRVLDSVSWCALLVLTTKHYCLLKVLHSFGVPQVFVMTLGMCYRYVYLFIGIIQNTYLAIKSRTGNVSSLKSGQGIVTWNITSLWQRSFALHNDVYNAMLSRGYTGEAKFMDESGATFKDWICLGVAILIFVGTLWQNHFLN